MHHQQGSFRIVRHIAIFALAFQQYLALALISAVIPVVLRVDGTSLEVVGLFSAAMFAFTINFLWAPLVDRHRPGWFGRLGLRRSWLLVTQIGSALVVAAMGVMNPALHVGGLFVAGVVLALVVATQRIATLGYVADVLAPSERGTGAAAMGCGAAIANAGGGAACLALVAALGWQPAVLIFAAGLLILGLTLLRLPEPEPTAPPPTGYTLRIMAGTPQLWGVASTVAPAAFGIAMAYAMAMPRLVDAGFEMTQVGLLGAGANVLTFLMLAPAAGLVVGRMQPRRAVPGSCLLLAVLLMLAAAAGMQVGAAPAAIIALAAVMSAIAIQHVAFTSWFLALARSGHAASDVTFLTAMVAAVALAGFALSGPVAEHFGYGATLFCAAAGYGLSALLVWMRSARRHTPACAGGPV